MTREYEFPSELKALHSLTVELGREPGSAVSAHYGVLIKPDGIVEIHHHPDDPEHTKWLILIADNIIEIGDDKEALICAIPPPYERFYFVHERSPLPCVNFTPREIALPGGLTLSAKDVYRRIRQVLRKARKITKIEAVSEKMSRKKSPLKRPGGRVVLKERG